MIIPLSNDSRHLLDRIVKCGLDRTTGFQRRHSFFHSPDWVSVLKEAYGYQPLFFTHLKETTPSALVPVVEVRSFLTGKRGVSVPFSDYCEPIVSDRSSFLAIFDEIVEYGKKAKWRYLEIRGGAEYLPGVAPYRRYLGHVLRIEGDEEDLFRGLSPGCRRNVRRAIDLGVRARVSFSEQDLHSFYRMHCLTRKRHGLPPQPHSFFRAIYRNVIARGRGFTVLGACRGRPVAGAVYLCSSSGKGIFKYGASDLRYQHLRANNLVMWEAIRWFSKNGFHEMCFGRTDVENAGLARFKEGWGARDKTLSYYRYDFGRSAFVRDASGRGDAAHSLFKRLPVPFLRIAGLLLYRHMG